MKKEKTYTSQESLNISVEEFDAMEGKHKFSKEYKKKKRKMLRDFRKENMVSTGINYAKVAVAASVILISTPLLANAATNGELFDRIWGNLGKEDITTHEEMVYDADKEASYTVTYPERDYETVDSEKVDELIGENVSYDSIEKQIGDTKLTILASVVDGNSAVVEFTLEKEGGVDALTYSQLDNEDKGAGFSEEATFDFNFKECVEKIYVDLDKSTDDKLYCYDYMVTDAFNHGSNGLTLEINEYPCTRVEVINADEAVYEKILADTKTSTISIPVKSEVETMEYVNEEGGKIEISPLSMKIDMRKGLGLTKEEAYDPGNVFLVSINYEDGSSYVVSEHKLKGKHQCEAEIDNSSNACSDLQDNLICIFNRLVDMDNVASVTVNESTYTLK